MVCAVAVTGRGNHSPSHTGSESESDEITWLSAVPRWTFADKLKSLRGVVVSRSLLNVGFCLVVCTLFCTSAFSNEATENGAWVSFTEGPTEQGVKQRIHVQATVNLDPDVLKVISSFVHRAIDQPMLLVSYGDADVRIRTERFIVARIRKKKLTVATNSLLPEASSRLLTKRLTRMGYKVELVAPKKLLLRTNASDEHPAEFIVPFREASAG